MTKKLKLGLIPIYILIPVLSVIAQVNPVIQQLNRKEYKDELTKSFKTLTLATILSQGLSQNYDEKIRSGQKKIEALNWENLKDSFWLPNINLALTTSKHRLGTMKKGTLQNNSQYPVGTFGLNFGEYTIFNWGKDYLQYQNDRSTIKRNQESLDEQRRSLKHQFIMEYFNLVTLKKLETSKRNILRQSSFIYRFAKERIGLRKISRHDYLAARDSYLKAQADFYEAKDLIQVAQEKIAYLIKDPVGTQYVIDEEINYKKLTMPLAEAVGLAKKYSQYTKQSQHELVNAKRSYEISIKENLPLPKVTLDLGAYQHAFGNGLNQYDYFNGAGNSLEIVASVNATWTILGSGGLFNRRTRIGKLVAFNQAQINHQRYKHFIESQIRTYYTQVRNSEKRYMIYKVKLENLNKTFDYIMDRYMNGKISFLYFKTYLDELRETEADFYNTLNAHVKYKVQLADLLGVDDFPGENFSNLAIRTIK